MEEYEPSLQAFWKGYAITPDNADLHFNAGTAYDKLNRFDDVGEVNGNHAGVGSPPCRCIELPRYSYAERGVKIEEAIALIKQAVALRPTNGYYVDSLAWAFQKGSDRSLD